MGAVAKYGTPSPISKLPDGHNRVGSGYIVGEDIAAGDACTLVPNTTAISAGVPTMMIMRADATGGDAAKAFVHGFAPQAAKVAQADALTLIRDCDWAYGQGLINSFLSAAGGPVPVYLSGSVKGGLDTAPAWFGQQPCGVILDDNRIRLWGTEGYLNMGDTYGLVTGVRNDGFALAVTGGNGGAFAWQSPFATPLIIPAGDCIADIKTVATSACTLSVGTAANGTSAGTNLLNAQDVHTAAGLFSNTAAVKVAANGWVTGTLSAGAGLVGNLYLRFNIVAN